jgi:hypothetical protein
MKWVNINERLPEEGGDVWCSFLSQRGAEVVVGILSKGRFYNSATGAEIPVKYWMPYYAPKPPKALSMSPIFEKR